MFGTLNIRFRAKPQRRQDAKPQRRKAAGGAQRGYSDFMNFSAAEFMQ